MAIHNAFFAEALDNFCTLRIQNPAAAASAVSTQRLKDMKKLGALVGLMVLGCLKPGRIEPLFIHYLVHDCNFHSLTQELVADWHPDLANLIKRWIQTGPSGDIHPFESHLMSYHDIQVRDPGFISFIERGLIAHSARSITKQRCIYACRIRIRILVQGCDGFRGLPSPGISRIPQRIYFAVPWRVHATEGRPFVPLRDFQLSSYHRR